MNLWERLDVFHLTYLLDAELIDEYKEFSAKALETYLSKFAGRPAVAAVVESNAVIEQETAPASVADQVTNTRSRDAVARKAAKAIAEKNVKAAAAIAEAGLVVGSNDGPEKIKTIKDEDGNITCSF